MGLLLRLGWAITLELCPSGLRLRMLWLFGPFCRPLFIPWHALTVETTRGIFFTEVKLRFGRWGTAHLRVPDEIASRLEDAVRTHSNRLSAT